VGAWLGAANGAIAGLAPAEADAPAKPRGVVFDGNAAVRASLMPGRTRPVACP
jgi:hypothetical protein